MVCSLWVKFSLSVNALTSARLYSHESGLLSVGHDIGLNLEYEWYTGLLRFQSELPEVFADQTLCFRWFSCPDGQ